MALKIIVCAKQVPDTNEIKIDPIKKTLIREGVPSILNHDDSNALEEALKIKDTYPDTYITVVTMGPPQAKDMLIECMAKGADAEFLLQTEPLVVLIHGPHQMHLQQPFKRLVILILYSQVVRPLTEIPHR